MEAIARLVCPVLAAGLLLIGTTGGQQPNAAPEAQSPVPELPPVPKGVEVLARGPVHEAFASPTTAPVPTKAVPKRPPEPLDELPPEQKPEGDVVWIGGYWAWDDDRQNFLWVSGVWRTPPPGKCWIAGYWHQDGERWQWVPGLWTAADPESRAQEVAYLPAPPAPPDVAPGEQPTADSIYVPGVWIWTGDRYVWRAGYWAHVQPGYVWVAAHYSWTPSGYVFIPGYWDLALPRRGVLFAPVIVDETVLGPTFVYTPAYVVRDSLMLDALFVRPCYCHYYFGDYYGPVYREYGYESCVIYSRRRYDPIFVYARWEHRGEPYWERRQVDICLARHGGRAPLPPRTLVQQNIILKQNVTNVTNVTNVNVTSMTNINHPRIVNRPANNGISNQAQVLVPASQMAAAKGIKTVPVDLAARVQAQRQAQALQQAAWQRRQIEVKLAGDRALKPHVAALPVPAVQPIGRPSPESVGSARVPQSASAMQKGERPSKLPAASSLAGQSRQAPAVGSSSPPAVAPGMRPPPMTAAQLKAPPPGQFPVAQPLSTAPGAGWKIAGPPHSPPAGTFQAGTPHPPIRTPTPNPQPPARPGLSPRPTPAPNRPEQQEKHPTDNNKSSS